MTFSRRCTACQKDYIDYDEWITHLIDEHMSQILKSNLQCNACEGRFIGVSEAFLHLELAHSSVSVCCQTCGAIWANIDSFINFCLREKDQCMRCELCSCVCGYSSDEEDRYTKYFDENDYIMKYHLSK